MININDNYRVIEKFNKVDFERMEYIHDGIEEAILRDDWECYPIEAKRYTKKQLVATIEKLGLNVDEPGDGWCVTYSLSDEKEFTVQYDY